MERWVASTAGRHPKLDEALALGVGGEDDLVHDAALAVPERAADVLLGEPLRGACRVVREGGRLAYDHVSLRRYSQRTRQASEGIGWGSYEVYSCGRYARQSAEDTSVCGTPLVRR